MPKRFYDISPIGSEFNSVSRPFVSQLNIKLMEQRAFKNVNNCLNTNIYSALETSGGKSFNLCKNVVHFFNTSVN
jgi:hypothetical protein